MSTKTNDQIKAIAQGIIQCCLFADKPEGTNPRVTKQAYKAAESIAKEFVGLIGDDVLVETVEAYKELSMSFPEYSELECIGHDVYFTMRGHGVGFWDRDFLKVDMYDEPIELGQVLTEACRKLKHREPTFYKGWLYIE